VYGVRAVHRASDEKVVHGGVVHRKRVHRTSMVHESRSVWEDGAWCIRRDWEVHRKRVVHRTNMVQESHSVWHEGGA